MKFMLNATNSRYEFEEYDPEDSYDENLLGVDRYSFTGGIYIHASDDCDEEMRQIGSIQATFLDEKLISNEQAGPLARIADGIDEDSSKAFLYLEKSSAFHRSCSGGVQSLPFHSCYISTFYIDPVYRSQGLGTHLLKDLSRIYLHLFNVYINCVVVYSKPFCPKEGWRDQNEETYARKRMCEFFEKNGFEKIGDSGFYARNYKIEL